MYSQLLQYDHACVWFERALQTTSKSKYHEAVVLQNMGAAYKFQGQYHVAVDCFEKAAEIYGRMDFTLYMYFVFPYFSLL